MNLVSRSIHYVHEYNFILVWGFYNLICFEDGRMNGPVNHGATKDDSFIMVGPVKMSIFNYMPMSTELNIDLNPLHLTLFTSSNLNVRTTQCCLVWVFLTAPSQTMQVKSIKHYLMLKGFHCVGTE